MDYQEIEKLQSDLWEKISSFENEHELLKFELKQLSKELAFTFNSSRKFDIMQQMKKIEEKIKQDFQSLKNQQGYIENEKRKIRMQKYETQTKIAINKTAQIKEQIKEIQSKPQEIQEKTQEIQEKTQEIQEKTPVVIPESENINKNPEPENNSTLKFDIEEIKKHPDFLWDLALNQNEILITENEQPLFKIVPCKNKN